jgi:hypothetical protein
LRLSSPPIVCVSSPAGLLTQVALLGNVALRFPDKKLLWDPENMKITNVPEANNCLHYEYRKGWSI